MLTVTTLPGASDMSWADTQPVTAAPDGGTLAFPSSPPSSSSPGAPGGSAPAAATGGAGNASSASGSGSGGWRLERPPGYAVFVDGVLRGLLDDASQRDTTNRNDTQVQVSAPF